MESATVNERATQLNDNHKSSESSDVTRAVITDESNAIIHLRRGADLAVYLGVL